MNRYRRYTEGQLKGRAKRTREPWEVTSNPKKLAVSLSFLVKGIFASQNEDSINHHFAHTPSSFQKNFIQLFYFCIVLPLLKRLELMHFDSTSWERQHNVGSDDHVAGDAWPADVYPQLIQIFVFVYQQNFPVLSRQKNPWSNMVWMTRLIICINIWGKKKMEVAKSVGVLMLMNEKTILTIVHKK